MKGSFEILMDKERNQTKTRKRKKEKKLNFVVFNAK